MVFKTDSSIYKWQTALAVMDLYVKEEVSMAPVSDEEYGKQKIPSSYVRVLICRGNS